MMSSSLRSAVDTVLFSKSVNELQPHINDLNRENLKVGLKQTEERLKPIECTPVWGESLVVVAD